MLFSPKELIPNCFHCGAKMECNGMSMKGWDMNDKDAIVYSTLQCIYCVMENIESKVSITYQTKPVVSLSEQHAFIGDIKLETIIQTMDNKRTPMTKISKYKSYISYNNKVSLEYEVLLHLPYAVTFDIASKESVEETIKTLLTFK